MAQKVTESVKGMDQKAETVAEGGKGLEGSAFQSSVSRGSVARAQGSRVSRLDRCRRKASGTATADDVFTVATGIKLTSGKTYTLSCGNNSVGYPFIKNPSVTTFRTAD